MPEVKILCPDCGQSYKGSAEGLGRRMRCKRCGSVFQLKVQDDGENGRADASEKHGGELAATVDEKRSETPRSAGAVETNKHPPAAADVKPPRKMGRFEIRGLVGVGGFGKVYRAYDPVLKREVALKIPQAIDSEETGKRLLREARAAAGLRHPHIVPTYDAGFEGGQFYIASAFIEGDTLAEAITAKRIDLKRAVTIVRQLAEALAYAHEQGIVHRDIKPHNVMLDKKGQPHLMDFGLARLEGSQEQLTQDGTLLGTPVYMSPEQASRDKQKQVGPASDQYSLGVVLYELLCGERPFEGPLEVVLYNVLKEEPQSPRTINPKVPKDLETICQKVMSKETPGRYGSCQELSEDLRRWQEDEPIHARRVGPVERAWRWSKRNPVTAALTSMAAGLLVLVAVVTTIGYQQTSRALAREEAARQDAIAEKDRADKNAARAEANAAEKSEALDNEAAQRQLADEARQKEATERKRADDSAEKERLARVEAEATAARLKHSLYASDMNLAQRNWEASNIAGVLRLLETHRPASGGVDLRGWEWFYQWRLCHSDLRTLEGHPGSVFSVAFSPDGRQLASACASRAVKLWDAETGDELRTLKGRFATFSPDGELLASASADATVKIWDAESGKEIHTLVGHQERIDSLAFSPDGKRLASAGWDRTVKLWDVGSGEELRTLKGHSNPVYSVAFSPDGRRLASASHDRTVKLWDAESGKELRTLKGHSGAVSSVAFSPDGRRLASAGWDATVKIWDAESGEELRTLEGHSREVYSVAFSPDGRRLASASFDRTVKLWDAESGEELRTLKGHSGAVSSVAFSPDGRRLASASLDKTVKIWNVDSSKELITIEGYSQNGRSAAFSPDGRRLASVSGDYRVMTIMLWDANSGAKLRTLHGHSSSILSVAFSPDSRRLASASYDETVKIWDAESGEELRTLKGHSGAVSSVAFSPDGRRLASASGTAGSTGPGLRSDNTVKLWDAESGEELRTLEGHSREVNSVAFSPDGRRLASASSDKTIKLWDANSGAELRTLHGHSSRILSVTFSPDGKRLASASYEGTVKLWDVGSGEELRTLKGHSNPVYSVAFSPDGRRLASASHDRTVKLWDTESGAELRTLKGHGGAVGSVAFSPDGSRLVAASAASVALDASDITVRLWDTTIITSDEKMARSLVDGLFDELASRDEVIRAIGQKTNWTDAMRKAGLEYARRRASNRSTRQPPGGLR